MLTPQMSDVILLAFEHKYFGITVVVVVIVVVELGHAVA
jgi:hypothetical protein